MRGFRKGETPESVQLALTAVTLEFYASHGTLVVPVPAMRVALVARWTMEGRTLGAGAVQSLMDKAVVAGLARYVRLDDGGTMVPVFLHPVGKRLVKSTSKSDPEAQLEPMGRYMLVDRFRLGEATGPLARYVAGVRSRYDAIVLADSEALKPRSRGWDCLACGKALMTGVMMTPAVCVTGGMASSVGFAAGKPSGYMHQRCFDASRGDIAAMTS